MIKTLNLNVFGTKSDVAPLNEDLIDSHLLETTSMSLLLLSIPGQPQDLLLWMFLEMFFFQSGFSFTTIHESQDCTGRGRAFL